MKKFFLILALACADSFANAQCSVNLVTAANVDCAGACTGWATVAGNGIPPFSFLWSNNDTGATATNLCAGVHIVQMFDAGGCSAALSVIITEPPPINISISVTYLNCSCQATANVTGGVSPYVFMWCDGSSGSVMTNCIAGVCPLTIIDGNGCIVTDTVIISPPPALTINPIVTNTSCGGCSDGMIIINPSGGLMPYQFSLNGNPVANDTITNLTAGIYVVCLTDEWSCTVCDTIQISDPTSITSPQIPNNFLKSDLFRQKANCPLQDPCYWKLYPLSCTIRSGRGC
jgi:hypothetical protein